MPTNVLIAIVRNVGGNAALACPQGALVCAVIDIPLTNRRLIQYYFSSRCHSTCTRREWPFGQDGSRAAEIDITQRHPASSEGFLAISCKGGHTIKGKYSASCWNHGAILKTPCAVLKACTCQAVCTRRLALNVSGTYGGSLSAGYLCH